MSLFPKSQPGLTRVVASKSHLNEETRAFIDGIPGEIELVQAGSSLKLVKIAEGLLISIPGWAPRASGTPRPHTR